MSPKQLMGVVTLYLMIGLVILFYVVNRFTVCNDPEYNTTLLHRSMSLVAALGILNFARYTVFSGSMGWYYGGVWETQGNLYQFQVGMSHLAFSITALCAYLNGWSTQTEKAILTTYALFLTGSLFTHLYAIVIDRRNVLWRLFSFILLLALIIPLFQIAVHSRDRGQDQCSTSVE